LKTIGDDFPNWCASFWGRCWNGHGTIWQGIESSWLWQTTSDESIRNPSLLLWNKQ